ncbi:MAG TPA: hypothetical protein EYN96_11505 [Candidatus Hydrogenedentes bacterium]|nr:hypothetical protein [Candidatus Hydrogenedentota bacterium]
MQITVDDESGFVLKSNLATVGDVLLEVTDHIQSKNRAIQAIIVDGKNIPPEELTQNFGKTPISEIDTVEVRSAGLAELVVSTLEEIAEVIPELPTDRYDLAQILAGDDPASCFAQFNQFLDIWEVLKDRQAQVIGLLNVEIETASVGGASIARHNAMLNDCIRNARKSMESSDFPGLSDLLSHELAEMAEVEEQIIEMLRTKI